MRKWLRHIWWNRDVLWWLQSDIVRLWKFWRSGFTLYQAAIFMPKYDYTVWGSK